MEKGDHGACRILGAVMFFSPMGRVQQLADLGCAVSPKQVKLTRYRGEATQVAEE